MSRGRGIVRVMAFCTQCGADLKGAFCAKCGAPAAQAADPAAAAPPPAASTPAPPAAPARRLAVPTPAPTSAPDPALDEALERISDLAARLWAVRSAHRPVARGWRRTHARCAECGQAVPCATLQATGEEFVRTAAAKGLTRAQALIRHGLPSVGLSVITVLGLQPRAAGAAA